jgi:TusA-related sulfurtransferase
MKQYKLDITSEHCPMTFVKTRIELDKLQDGDRLEVILREGEPLDNVPKAAKEQGYRVLKVYHIDKDIHGILIEK